MVLKLDTSENISKIPGKFRNAAEGWRRSVGPFAWKIKYYVESRKRGIYTLNKPRKAEWVGYISRWNCLLNHVEGKRSAATG
jgi:hypothetical protein